jgi:hypothetical protein
MLPLVSFETGRRTQTQSWWATGNDAPANGSLVLSQIGTAAERPTHAEKNQKEFTPRAPPKRVRGAFAHLTKTYHGCRLIGKVAHSTCLVFPVNRCFEASSPSCGKVRAEKARHLRLAALFFTTRKLLKAILAFITST